MIVAIQEKLPSPDCLRCGHEKPVRGWRHCWLCLRELVRTMEADGYLTRVPRVGRKSRTRKDWDRSMESRYGVGWWWPEPLRRERPARRKQERNGAILGALRGGPTYAGELAARLIENECTVRYSLKGLEKAGAVVSERRGKRDYWRLAGN